MVKITKTVTQQGRVMKVNLKGDEFDPRLYDRDNGQGAAQRVIDALRAK